MKKKPVEVDFIRLDVSVYPESNLKGRPFIFDVKAKARFLDKDGNRFDPGQKTKFSDALEKISPRLQALMNELAEQMAP